VNLLLEQAVTILTGNGTLRTEVEHLTKMNELMKKSYESCQADWTKLNKRHQDCLTELNKQAFSITASQTTMADLGRLANDEAARVSVLERRLEEAKEKHEEETATVQGTMQAKLADANAQLAEARATVQSAQDKAAADVYLLEQQLEEANEKYKEATAEVAVVRGTAEAKLTDASAELAEARATARAAQDKAAVDIHPLEQKLAEANEKYEETVAELAISRDTTQAQLAKTNAELAKAQATSKTAQANAAIDIRNLEQQLAEANEKYEKAAAEVVAIQDSDSQQELMEIKARLVEVQTAMEAAKDEATRRIHLLERQLVLSNGSIKESSTKLTEALLKSQKRKEELQSLRRDAGSHSQALTQGIQEAREKLLSEHQRAIQALKADMQGKLADTETKHKVRS
jgi:chromosome segregation ATPase